MTEYATHRFSVGQHVTGSGRSPGSFEVTALIADRNGPEYRIRSLEGGGLEAVVPERELTYSRAWASQKPSITAAV